MSVTDVVVCGLTRRLLLDRRHRSVALVSQSGAVLGGITYRVFGQQVRPREVVGCGHALGPVQRLLLEGLGVAPV